MITKIVHGIGLIIVIIGVVGISYALADGMLLNQESKNNACYSAGGTISVVACGMGCDSLACIVKDGNRYYKKSIAWVDGNYHLVEGKT